MVSAAKATLIRSIKETTSRMNRNQISRRKTLRNTRSSVGAFANMLDWLVAVIDASLAGGAGRRLVNALRAAFPQSDCVIIRSRDRIGDVRKPTRHAVGQIVVVVLQNYNRD